jgi:hypothetical protein
MGRPPRIWTAWRLERLREWRAAGVPTRVIAKRFRVSPAAVRVAIYRFGLPAKKRAMAVDNDYDPAVVEAAVQALIPHSPV